MRARAIALTLCAEVLDMRIWHFISLLAASAVLVCSGCGGGGGGGEDPVLLGEIAYQVDVTGSSNPTALTGVLAFVGFTTPEVRVEMTPELTGGEIGIPFTVDADDSAEAASYAARWVNGVDETTVIGDEAVPAVGGGTSGGLESGQIVNKHPSLIGPDLAGSRVTRIVLTFSEVSVTPGNSYAYRLVGTVQLLGRLE